jgi:hypothetical protein
MTRGGLIRTCGVVSVGYTSIHEADMRRLVDELRPMLKPQSIRNGLANVSRKNEQPRAVRLENPVACLDRADRDSIGPAWDHKATPWLKADHVPAVYAAMPELDSGQLH